MKYKVWDIVYVKKPINTDEYPSRIGGMDKYEWVPLQIYRLNDNFFYTKKQDYSFGLQRIQDSKSPSIYDLIW